MSSSVYDSSFTFSSEYLLDALVLILLLIEFATKRHHLCIVNILTMPYLFLLDATGTFMACAHAHHDCRIGVIFGTGTNACYLESAAKVGTWQKANDDDGNVNVAENVIVNTSWGYFGGNGCLDFVRTEFDKENDARSSQPGQCVFEKLVAGHYLGEVVRLALIKLHKAGILFRDSTAFGPSLAPPFPYANGEQHFPKLVETIVIQ